MSFSSSLRHVWRQCTDITSLHCMQRGLSDRKAVCLFVCLSVKTKESSADILTLYERSGHLVFWHEEWLVGDVPSTWNFGPNWPLPRFKNGYLQSIFTRNASAFTPSEKSSIIANMRSTTGFPMSLEWTAYVAPKPPKGGSKTQSVRLPYKSGLLPKTVCYKVSLCENFQRQIHSLAYLSVHKWLVGDVASYLKFWAKLTNSLEKRQLRVDIRS